MNGAFDEAVAVRREDVESVGLENDLGRLISVLMSPELARAHTTGTEA